ncbi:MAG: FAD-binding oxidoreductase [Proteobacteria bacterium]|nr:FAD-binding oxidoreductase [Pseudomonadota bacterium]
MLPQLETPNSLLPLYSRFFDKLKRSDFSGEIKTAYSDRLIMATDNSIYQVLPQGVVYPSCHNDVVKLFQLLNIDAYSEIKIAPRGGGTATNGQSLNRGIVMDLSKLMNEILELNLEEGWVRVQPGVVRDQLNDFLKPHQQFFAPTLSTSNRATIGGMINTDASGKGSRVYGKTSNHVLELKSVLADGTTLNTKEINSEELLSLTNKAGREGGIYSLLKRITTDYREQIELRLPKLTRFLTGYNLEKIVSTDRRFFNLNFLLTGSEGTLAVTTEAKLKITPRVRYKKLLLVKYRTFDDALSDARLLVDCNPSAIETIDDKILALAKKDVIYGKVKWMIDDYNGTAIKAINLVEFSNNDLDELNNQVEPLERMIKKTEDRSSPALDCYSTINGQEIDAMWELRKKGVGLLGNAKGDRKPIAFVEDTAVPPQHLAAYIKEFRTLLEENGLEYGMFGHVDVGCLHVRPALDMKNPDDEVMLVHISNQVVALVQKYGGVMWGEHGKGFRSEYVPEFFGQELYAQLRKIKGEFDPLNRLNPGKIVIPLNSKEPLASINGPTRGQQDRQIHSSLRENFSAAIDCNGNGACFNYHPDDLMCPSMKVTRDRVQSPKGRAGVIREWLRQLSTKGIELKAADIYLESSNLSKGLNFKRSRFSATDFSHQVYDALEGCLACKACATQCPINVDVPDFKAKFLSLYHSRYHRPLRDYFVVNLEKALPYQAITPRFFNWVTGLKSVKILIKKVIGIVDIPSLSEKSVKAGLKKRIAPIWNPSEFAGLSDKEKQNSLILIQDSFTSFYESELVLQLYDLAKLLGVQLYVMPLFQNGKAYHVKGFLRQFSQIVRKNVRNLNELSQSGIPMVGIDPAIVLTYRMEYRKVLGVEETRFKIQLVQEWLLDYLQKNPQKKEEFNHQKPLQESYRLFGHCTERSAIPESQQQWETIFSKFGLKVDLEEVGCCGMCGVYGHEQKHLDNSVNIYNMSWKKKILKDDRSLATGYSCRSQVKRNEQFKPSHPISALLKHLQ